MIVYKLLKTPENYYVFDRNKNKILKISKEDYKELEDFQNKVILQEQLKCLSKYQRKGFLLDSVLEEVVHPETDYIKHYLNHRVGMLILQVTQNCNLRCAYCAYSGIYENRVHSNKVMSWETAKKSIDYLFSHSDEMHLVHISFYGGEPLLCIDLMKKCLDYVKDKFSDRKIQYGMTTNGTLLNSDIADFLIENDFAVTISLDGSKKDHDANRVFPNGKGSFDVIINNIKKLTQYDKRFLKHIRFNTVLNPKSDYGAIHNYFKTEEIVCDADIGMSFMESINCKEDIMFGEEFLNKHRYSFLQMYLIMLKKMKGTKLSNVMRSAKAGIDIDYEKLEKGSTLTKRCHHSGPCIPGATRMFVTVEGDIYSCEKATEQSEALRLGNLNEGISIEKVFNGMNIGKLCEEDCKACWAFNWCSMCSIFAEKDGMLDADTVRNHCFSSRSGAEEDLLNICVLKEFDYKFGKEEFYE